MRRLCDGTTYGGTHNCNRHADFVMWLTNDATGEGMAACGAHVGLVASRLSDGEPAQFELHRTTSDER